MSDVYATSLEFPVQNCSEVEEGTLSYLDAGGEQTVFELTTARVQLLGVWLDFSNLTHNFDVKLYYKVDGSNYREFDSHAFTVATDPDGVWLDVNAAIDSDFKVTVTEGDDEGAARDIPYQVFYRALI